MFEIVNTQCGVNKHGLIFQMINGTKKETINILKNFFSIKDSNIQFTVLQGSLTFIWLFLAFDLCITYISVVVMPLSKKVKY